MSQGTRIVRAQYPHKSCIPPNCSRCRESNSIGRFRYREEAAWKLEEAGKEAEKTMMVEQERTELA